MPAMTIFRRAGADMMNGGAGNDTAMYAGSAAESPSASRPRPLRRDASGDVLSAIENLIGSNKPIPDRQRALATAWKRGGADSINGGAGIDLASYAGSLSGVTVDLTLDGVAQVSGGDASGDIINADVEGIAGSNSADILIGDANANWLEGAGGIDTITTGAGIDRVFGGLGDDIIVLDTNLTAADQIDGGGGLDTVTLTASAAYAAGLALSKTSSPASSGWSR
jgi:Ca2+-binding RTX toxin-like protein